MMRPACAFLKPFRFRPVPSGLQSLWIILFLSSGDAGAMESLRDRFGGPLHASDVFPTTLQPFHPLNPADLAMASGSKVEFGFQPDGSHLILGLPNFLLSVADQGWEMKSETESVAIEARKYALGYGISTADLGWKSSRLPLVSLGFGLRYLDYLPPASTGNGSRWAFGDMGVSLWHKRFHLDAVLLNFAELARSDQAQAMGRPLREINAGAAYGPRGNWLIFARWGVQDSVQKQSIIDVGFEKLFFGNVTFRVASQRRYSSASDGVTRETASALSGGIGYRLASIGRERHYPERDLDLFSQGSLGLLLRDVEFGGLVVLGKTASQGPVSEQDRTTLIFTLSKGF